MAAATAAATVAAGRIVVPIAIGGEEDEEEEEEQQDEEEEEVDRTTLEYVTQDAQRSYNLPADATLRQQRPKRLLKKTTVIVFKQQQQQQQQGDALCGWSFGLFDYVNGGDMVILNKKQWPQGDQHHAKKWTSIMLSDEMY